MHRAVHKASSVIQQIEECLLAVAVSMIAIMTIMNVLCRSLLGFSLAFAEEVSQFCIIIVTFAGLSYAASKGRHIRMTALYDQLTPKARKTFMIGITGSTALIMLVLAWFACQYVLTVYELGGVYPVLRIPYWAVYSIVPIGLFLAGMQYALAAFRNLTSDEVYLSFETLDEYEEVVTHEI